MRGDKLVAIIAPLFFRVEDKFFKFLFWAIIISAVGYIKINTGSVPLAWVHAIASIIWSSALLMQAYYMFMRDPADWKVPHEYRMWVKVPLFFAGVFLLFVCTSPYFLLDTIIQDLMKAHANR